MTKQLTLLIDLDNCIGCHACTVACKMENNIESDAWVNVLTIGGGKLDWPAGVYPNLSLQYLPVSCMHCENPPCVDVCPTSAMYKRREDGIVLVDSARCIGCRLCVWACPYNVIDYSTKQDLDRVVSKCTLCSHRVDIGLKPACVETCSYGARLFGDLLDPESTVSKRIREKNGRVLLPEQRTKPSVHYVGYGR